MPFSWSLYRMVIEHAAGIPADKINRFTVGAQGKSKLILVEGKKAAGGNRPLSGMRNLLVRGIVREPATGKVHRAVRVIVKLNEIELGSSVCARNSVDDHVLLRVG